MIKELKEEQLYLKAEIEYNRKLNELIDKRKKKEKK